MTVQVFPCLMLALLISGCATQQEISFQSDIDPILHAKCQRCHVPPNGIGYVQTGLNMQSYDTLMKGTMFGTVIIPGDSKRSVINKLVEGRAGEIMRMPHRDAKKLT
ncbi:MAG: c-type cytochrome domain-containing protein, partial [Gammaproteobacteria bacterium]